MKSHRRSSAMSFLPPRARALTAFLLFFCSGFLLAPVGANEHSSIMAPVSLISTQLAKEPPIPRKRRRRFAEPRRDPKKNAKATQLASRIQSTRGGGGSHQSIKDVVKLRGGSQLIARLGESKRSCWAILGACILLDTIGTSMSKRARDTSNLPLFLASCCIYLLSMGGFAISLAQIEVGVAYALWGAIGSVLVTTSGILLFGESYDFAKLACLAMIICGVVGLNLREHS